MLVEQLRFLPTIYSQSIKRSGRKHLVLRIIILQLCMVCNIAMENKVHIGQERQYMTHSALIS